MVNGSVVSVMVTENNNGQMALVTKDNGKITAHTEKENSPTSMATSTKVTG